MIYPRLPYSCYWLFLLFHFFFLFVCFVLLLSLTLLVNLAGGLSIMFILSKQTNLFLILFILSIFFLFLLYLFPLWVLIFPSFCWLWKFLVFFFQIHLGGSLDCLLEIFLVSWGRPLSLWTSFRHAFAASHWICSYILIFISLKEFSNFLFPIIFDSWFFFFFFVSLVECCFSLHMLALLSFFVL